MSGLRGFGCSLLSSELIINSVAHELQVRARFIAAVSHMHGLFIKVVNSVYPNGWIFIE